jgi:hypothetical protein
VRTRDTPLPQTPTNALETSDSGRFGRAQSVQAGERCLTVLTVGLFAPICLLIGLIRAIIDGWGEPGVREQSVLLTATGTRGCRRPTTRCHRLGR